MYFTLFSVLLKQPTGLGVAFGVVPAILLQEPRHTYLYAHVEFAQLVPVITVGAISRTSRIGLDTTERRVVVITVVAPTALPALITGPQGIIPLCHQHFGRVGHILGILLSLRRISGVTHRNTPGKRIRGAQITAVGRQARQITAGIILGKRVGILRQKRSLQNRHLLRIHHAQTAVQNLSHSIDTGHRGPVEKVSAPFIRCTPSITIAVRIDKPRGLKTTIRAAISVTLTAVEKTVIVMLMNIRGIGHAVTGKGGNVDVGFEKKSMIIGQ